MKVEKSLPLAFTALFAAVWTSYEVSVALSRSIIAWDAMVYWLNGQSFLQGRWPLYEFFRPPVLPLILGFAQYLGSTIQTTLIFQPIATGLSGIVLFYVLRSFVRESLASVGTLLYLTTSVVEYWSTTILTHGFGNLFLLTGIYFLTRTNPGFKKEILGAMFLTIAVYTRYPLAIVAIPFGFWYLFNHKRVINVDALLIGGILPLSPFMLANPSLILDTANEIFGSEFLGQKNIFVGGTQFVTSPLIYFNWLINNLQVLFVFLAVGVFAITRNRRSPSFIFGLWLIPYLLAFSISSNRQYRFMFEVAPAIAALIVIGMEYSLQRFGSRRILGPALLLLIIPFTGLYFVDQTRIATSQSASIWVCYPDCGDPGLKTTNQTLVYTYEAVGYAIQSHSEPGDIVVAENDVPWLAYYSSRYVYLSETTHVTSGQAVRSFLLSFSPHPTLLVAVPSFGSNMGLLNSQQYLTLLESLNTTSWGPVYLYRVTLN